MCDGPHRWDDAQGEVLVVDLAIDAGSAPGSRDIVVGHGDPAIVVDDTLSRDLPRAFPFARHALAIPDRASRSKVTASHICLGGCRVHDEPRHLRMPDRDDLGGAWRVPPSRYLANRPPEF